MSEPDRLRAACESAAREWYCPPIDPPLADPAEMLTDLIERHVRPVVEEARAAFAGAINAGCNLAQERDAALELLREARHVVVHFRSLNPKWWSPERGEQDQLGVHALTPRIDALLARHGKEERDGE